MIFLKSEQMPQQKHFPRCILQGWEILVIVILSTNVHHLKLNRHQRVICSVTCLPAFGQWIKHIPHFLLAIFSTDPSFRWSFWKVSRCRKRNISQGAFLQGWEILVTVIVSTFMSTAWSWTDTSAASSVLSPVSNFDWGHFKLCTLSQHQEGGWPSFYQEIITLKQSVAAADYQLLHPERQILNDRRIMTTPAPDEQPWLALNHVVKELFVALLYMPWLGVPNSLNTISFPQK